MNLSSINSNLQSVLLPQVGSTQAANQNGACGSTGTSSGSGSVTMSKPAEMFSDLSALAKSDPDKFKALASQIADKLKTAAAGESGDGAKLLNDLASKFESAAQSGDASGLAPHHGHHGHHQHAAQATQTTDASSSAGQGNRAVDAYKKNGPPALSDSVKSTLDSVFELVQQSVGQSANVSK